MSFYFRQFLIFRFKILNVRTIYCTQFLRYRVPSKVYSSHIILLSVGNIYLNNRNKHKQKHTSGQELFLQVVFIWPWMGGRVTSFQGFCDWVNLNFIDFTLLARHVLSIQTSKGTATLINYMKNREKHFFNYQRISEKDRSESRRMSWLLLLWLFSYFFFSFFFLLLLLLYFLCVTFQNQPTQFIILSVTIKLKIE